MSNRLWTKDFTLLTVTNLLMAVAFYFMTPVMPLFVSDRFGAGTEEVGMVMFAFTITAILMRPFAGYLLDVLNRYVVYIVSFVVFTLLFLGYAFAATFTLVLFVRFIHGVTWGSMNTAAYTMAVDLAPTSRRGEGLGFFGLSMTVAMAVSPMLAMFISTSYSYNALFLSAVAFCIVGLTMVSFVKVPKSAKTVRKFSFSSLFEKSALSVAIVALLTQVPYGGILSFIALYGRELGVTNSGAFFLLLSVGVGTGRVLSGRMFDKWGPRKIIFSGISLLIIGLIVVGFFANSAGFHTAAIVLGFGFGILSPAFQAMANNNVPMHRRGAANSTYLMFFDSGIGIGMLLFGRLIESVGYSVTFYVSAAVVLLAATLFFGCTLPRYERF